MNAKPLLFFVVIAALLWSWAVEAAPIRVRLMEGNFRGFVVLKSLDGAAIAYGEVCQKATGDLVECSTAQPTRPWRCRSIAGADEVMRGGSRLKTMRSLVKLETGGLTPA